MKAIGDTKYWPQDVLQLKEIEKPTPKDDEVLVEIRAASVNAFDWHMLRAKPFLVRLMGGVELIERITDKPSPEFRPGLCSEPNRF